MLVRAALFLALPAALLSAGCAVLTQPVRRTLPHGPAVAADAQRLQALVEALAKPRDVADVAALDATAAYLAERLRESGYQPEEQLYQWQGRTYRNLRLVLGDPKRPRVVVGAHYDSFEALPAADDNASGVAVVLELARLFRERPPPGTVELVFWTLEEPPAWDTPGMGSVAHADALAAEAVPVVAALSIETVGYYRDEEGTQHFPVPLVGALYPSAGNFVALVSNLDNTRLVRTVKRAMRSTGRIPVYSMNGPALVEGIDWSDHRNFWRHGWPALMVTDTAPNRNPNYHQPTDTPDTLSYPRMARLTEALFEAVWVLAEGEPLD